MICHILKVVSVTAVSHEDFDYVASLLVKQGDGAVISNVNIESAFRILPINPAHIHLFGFTFEGAYFMDKCLPIGCSSCLVPFSRLFPQLFRTSLSLSTVFTVSHILDDFIFNGPSCPPLRQKQLECFLALADYSGIPITTSETVYLTQVAPIHGILINSSSLTA